MIRIPIALLEKQDIELVGDEPADFLELGPETGFEVIAPVSYRLLAQRVSAGALVTGQVATRIAGTCGRCLEPVEEPVTAAGVRLFYELAGESELDITEDVRAELLLELPMNLLCDDDCAGLCPVCGANRNVTDCACQPAAAAPETDAPNPWNALDGLKENS